MYISISIFLYIFLYIYIFVWGRTLVCIKMSTKQITQCNSRDLLQPMTLIVWGRTWVCINVNNELVCIKIYF